MRSQSQALILVQLRKKNLRKKTVNHGFVEQVDKLVSCLKQCHTFNNAGGKRSDCFTVYLVDTVKILGYIFKKHLKSKVSFSVQNSTSFRSCVQNSWSSKAVGINLHQNSGRITFSKLVT